MKKTRSPRYWKILGATFAVVVVLGLIGRFWVVPAIIRGQLQARYGGLVEFRGWWLGRSSAGVKNLELGEGPERSSPIWASAKRVETDLSIGKLMRGRFLPNRITLDQPTITFRIGEDGKPLTRPPLKGGEEQAEVPDVVVKDGRVTLAQEGRPEMTIGHLEATLFTRDGKERVEAETDDPMWGKWVAVGRFEPGFTTGQITLMSQGDHIVTADKIARIPFVPRTVWEQVDPRGPVAITLDVTTGATPRIVTTCQLEGATVKLPTLGLVAETATGTMTIDGPIVRMDNFKGTTIGGAVAASGTLDFGQQPPRFDITLDLDHVDVGQTPKSWQLADSGITGKLTGRVHLVVALTPEGADLTGSAGDAVISEGTIGGVPVKSLKIAMKAEGESLEYETKTDDAPTSLLTPEFHRLFDPKVNLDLRIAPLVVGLWIPPAVQIPAAVQEPAKPKKAGGFVLPKTLSTDVEFSDVDLVEVLARLNALGIPVPFVVGGKLSLKAKATIPLGTLRDVKLYAFHGQAVLSGATIDGVDLGDVRAKLDLQDGVLDLTEFRGRLVDRPDGDAAHPSPSTEPIPLEGALPEGGFRGRLHAELSPPGRLESHFEGNALPLGELLAPALPYPTPVAGIVSFAFDAGADLTHWDDPASWEIAGTGNAARISYRGTSLDGVATTFALKNGRVTIPDLVATLGKQPLKAKLGLDVRPPYGFEADLDVKSWNLDSVLAFVPEMPSPSPIGGKFTGATRAQGTIAPRSWEINGQGKLQAFRAGEIVLGDLPVQWKTEGDVIRVSVEDLQPRGGSLSLHANIPAKGDGAITGNGKVVRFDLATIAPQSNETPEFSGRVDGEGTFVIRPQPKAGESVVEGEFHASSDRMKLRGVTTRNLRAVATAKGGELLYDLYLEGLGGTAGLAGSVPVGQGSNAEAKGSLKAVGFRLEGIWKPIGMSGSVSNMRGLAAIDANLLTRLVPNDLRVRGNAEIRDLSWGPDFPLGVIKGSVTFTPMGWQIDRVTGDVLGGILRGSSSGKTPARGAPSVEFSADIERASLRRAMAFLPDVASRVDGSGSLRVRGTLADSLRATGEITVPSGRMFDLPLDEFRAPIELLYAPNGDVGSLSLRRWTSRFAGGRLTGDVRMGVGNNHAFTTETQLSAIDVESFSRVMTDAKRPASGKVSGKVVVSGADPQRTETYRGRIDLNLEAASLFELPVFREIERLLGSARGGTFDDGELHASITNRQVVVERLTLEGRLMQMHATGTVGFDSRLDLEVLVNTNQIIGQTGQALVGIIPGLSDAVGRRSVVFARLGNYLQNRLLKFRVTGTVASPTVSLDPALAVTEGAVGFFAGALKLPLGLFR